MDKIINEVPCNGCVLCCQYDDLYLHPENGDVINEYETLQRRGRTVLAKKNNGDCVYLDRSSGCLIHGKQPISCREFDCRILLKIPRKKRRALISKGLVAKTVIEAARKRIEQVEVNNV